GDVTIREPRPLISPWVEQAARFRGVHAVHRRVEARAERLDVLSLNDRKLSYAGVLERVPVVCCVQLASETGRPAGLAAKRREERGCPFGDSDVHGRPQVGNGEGITRETPNEIRRYPYRKP